MRDRPPGGGRDRHRFDSLHTGRSDAERGQGTPFAVDDADKEINRGAVYPHGRFERPAVFFDCF